MAIVLKDKVKEIRYELFYNDDVIEFLTSKFNQSLERFKVISKSVFFRCNAVVVSFDGVSFLINASDSCAEIAFNIADEEKLIPLINEIKKWDKLLNSHDPFCVKIDKGDSRSLLFESGYQKRSQYKVYFSNHNPEIIEIISNEAK